MLGANTSQPGNHTPPVCPFLRRCCSVRVARFAALAGPQIRTHTPRTACGPASPEARAGLSVPRNTAVLRLPPVFRRFPRTSWLSACHGKRVRAVDILGHVQPTEIDMADLNVLEQRLARAKAALRDEKKRAKEREDQQILSVVRRSGLTLVSLETLLTNPPGAASVSEPGSDQS